MTHNPTNSDLAFDLYAEWEDRSANGEGVSIEAVCAGHPAELPRVRAIARQLSDAPCLRLTREAAEPAEKAGQADAQWVEVGRGASSVVYRGHDPGFGTTVAFKVLRPRSELLSPAELNRLMRRFEQEARILARLKHEAVVRIFKTFIRDGRPVLEMEYLPGGSLADRWDAVRGRGAPAVARFAERIARAVGFAHHHGIVHRDLKPSNILLDAASRPCVSDFGVAKLVDPDDADLAPDDPPDEGDTDAETACLTAVGRQPGTKAYMAPEQFDPAAGPITPATDVWALGVILYELVNGTRPFSGGTPDEWKAAVCRGPLPRRRWRVWKPESRLEAVALRCLARDPAKRYPTASALAAALAASAQPRWPKPAVAAGFLTALAAVAVAFAVRGRAVPADPGPSRAAIAREAREAFRLCETGRVSRGLFAFADLLNRVPPDAPELRDAIRANIAGWAAVLPRVEGLYTHPESISALGVSRCGRWVAVGDDRGGVAVWDATAGRAHKRLAGHTGRVLSAGFSPDGRLLATGGDDRTVRVWHVEGPEADAAAAIPVGARPFAVAFTPDGDEIAVGTQSAEESDRRGVNIWNARTGQRRAGAHPSPHDTAAFAVSPDGRTLVALAVDGAAQVWDLAGRQLRGALAAEGPHSAIRSAAFAPDGKTIATGGDDLRFWDAETCGLLSTERREDAAAIGFAPDGRSLAVHAGGRLRVWHPGASCFDPLPLPRPAETAVRWAAGEFLFGVESKRTLIRLRWPEPVAVCLPVPRDCIALYARPDPSGTHAAVVTAPDLTQKRVRSVRQEAGIAVWDIRTGSPAGPTIRPKIHPLVAVAFGSNHRLLAYPATTGSAGGDCPVRLIDPTDGREVGALRGHSGDVLCVHALADRRHAWVTAGNDGSVRFWSPDGVQRHILDLAANPVKAALSPSGHFLVVGCGDGRVVRVDLSPEPAVRWVSESSQSGCHQVLVSADGTGVAARGRDNDLRAWAASNGAPLPVPSAARNVAGISVDPAGSGWVTFHTDGAVRWWSSFAAVRHDRGWTPSEGDPCVGIDPTGTVLIAAAADGAAQAWSIPAGLPIGPPVYHYRGATAVVWVRGRALTLCGKSVRAWSPADGTALPDDARVSEWLTAETAAVPNRPFADAESAAVRTTGRDAAR